MNTNASLHDGVPYKIASVPLGTFETVLLLSFVGPLIVFTMVSNSLVVRAISNFPPLKNPPNQLLLSLAFTDLLSASFVMPVACYYSISGVWQLGTFACKAWLFSSQFLCGSSIIHLCAIAIDRYRAIIEPLTYGAKRSNKKSLVIICFSWTLSFIIVCPTFYRARWPMVFHENVPCTIAQDPPTAIFAAMTKFFIPLLILMVTYLKMYLVNRARYKKKIVRASKTLEMKRMSMQKNGLTKSVKFVNIKKHEIDNDEIPIENSDSQKDILSKETHVGQDLNAISEEEESAVCPKANIESSSQTKDEKKSETNHVNVSKEFQAIDSNLASDENMDQRVTLEEVNGPTVVKCIVQGSKRRHFLPNRKVDLNRRRSAFLGSKCRLCQGSMMKATLKGICQICASPNDLFLAAEEARLAILIYQERKSMFTVFIIVCTFIVCWAPVYTIYVLLTIFPSLKVPPILITCAIWLCYSNSACNPIIYTIFNKNFRKAFIKYMFRR